MTDPFPNQHTTTTTVQTSSTTVETTLRYDSSYVRTIPGMLKVAEIVSVKPYKVLELCLIS